MDDDARLILLSALIGNWKTTVIMINADGSEGAATEASDTYTWSANGKFVQHDVDADMGEGRRVQSLEVIALDPSGKGYCSRSYDSNGTYSDFTCELEGRFWRIMGNEQRFAGEFSEDGKTLAGQWSQNDGSGDFSPLMNVKLQRLN